MVEIVGIQFKNGLRLYYFSPNGYSFKVGDYAIVETVRGTEIGKVIIGNRMVEDDEINYELKPIIRPGTQADVERSEKYETMAPKSFEKFKKYVNQLNLPMKPLYAEHTIDGQKVVFYYTADDRVDFRELLKYLTPEFKCRVELRQIGPREAARYIGGIGNCGRVICCKSCMNTADFVTMKMAKDQNMSLNKDKINGLCEKLLCCIAYEHDIYMALKKELPDVGSFVTTPTGLAAKVVSVDYMKKTVKVLEEGKEQNTIYTAKELGFLTECDASVDLGVTNVTTSEVVNDPVVESTPVEDKPNQQNNDSNKKVYIINKKNNNKNNKFFNKKKKK